MKKIIPLFFSFWLISICTIYAQVESTTSQANEINERFDINLWKLPKNFKGDDFESLYRSLAIPRRGEFESAEDYEERKKNAPTGNYTFIIPEFRKNYDADTQTYEIVIHNRFYSDHPHYFGHFLIAKELIVDQEEYIGTTAFGVPILHISTSEVPVKDNRISNRKSGESGPVGSEKVIHCRNCGMAYSVQKKGLLCECGFQLK